MIGMINLGNSNIQSVINALSFLDIDYFVTEDPKGIKLADKLILPGVGSFGDGIARLKKNNMFEVLKEEVRKDKPIFGICLGMQLLFEHSEESPGMPGLELLKGNVLRLPESFDYKIPRVGWAESKLNYDFLGFNEGDAFDLYYLHSFFVQPTDSNIIAIQTENNIAAAIKHKNIYGCQFHPEKSHKNGLKLLHMFNEWNND